MSEDNRQTGDSRFPVVPVLLSALVLIAIGALLLNLASAGALPTGLGIGADMGDITRRVVISGLLLIIAVGAFVFLRRGRPS